MKKQKQFEKWAMELLKKYHDILLLQDHLLSLKQKDDINAYATHTFCYPYKETEVNYDKELYEMWEKGKLEDVKAILIHELCHSLTDPLYAKATNRYVGRDEIEDEREALTDKLANIIVKLGV